MRVKEQLKTEIDRLDERYLDLLYKIACQFPHVSQQREEKTSGREIANLLQEIANGGGLGIKDPQKWQHEVRRDRPLPFRRA